MNRNKSLDGIRGLLALAILCWHVAERVAPSDSAPYLFLSQFVVCGFFILSGLVLTRAWDGRYGAFLARRFVRLWPVYATCLAAAYIASGRPVVVSQFLWWPLIAPNDHDAVLRPAWSLCIEAWAMLAMPVFVWFSSRRWPYLLAGLVACLAAGMVFPQAMFGMFFLTGAFAARAELRLPILEGAIPQWLGRISYPLYLSQWIVLNHCPGPMLVRVLVAFATAQALTITVERCSIAASRGVGAAIRRWSERDAQLMPRPN